MLPNTTIVATSHKTLKTLKNDKNTDNNGNFKPCR